MKLRRRLILLCALGCALVFTVCVLLPLPPDTRTAGVKPGLRTIDLVQLPGQGPVPGLTDDAVRATARRLGEPDLLEADMGFGSPFHLGCHTAESYRRAVAAHAAASRPRQQVRAATRGNREIRDRTWRVALPGTWFGNRHDFMHARLLTCPSGCSIAGYRLARLRDIADAHVLVFHADDGPDTNIAPLDLPPVPGQRRALLVAENFRSLFNSSYVQQFNTDFSWRAGALFRDGAQYPMRALEGLPYLPAPHAALTWSELPFPPLVPETRRRPLSAGSITWATQHCGSRSGREAIVDEIAASLPVIAFGKVTDCLRLPPLPRAVEEEVAPLRNASRDAQHKLFRTAKFHLALENARCDGYVTEKIYLALQRGQVPVVLSAPDLDRFVPPGSYISLDDFSSVQELVQELRRLDADPAAYAQYHAWRTQVPISQYGDVLAKELMYILQVGNSSVPQISQRGAAHPRGISMWYMCMMCDALEAADVRARDVHQKSSVSTACEGVASFEQSCAPAWPVRVSERQPLYVNSHPSPGAVVRFPPAQK